MESPIEIHKSKSCFTAVAFYRVYGGSHLEALIYRKIDSVWCCVDSGAPSGVLSSEIARKELVESLDKVIFRPNRYDIPPFENEIFLFLDVINEGVLRYLNYTDELEVNC